jgi:two-component system sensor histidine kinase BaeS
LPAVRLRLVHTLSLLLLSSALVAVVALGGLTAWNLRNGFAAYLAARDAAHLESFAAYLERQLEQPGGLEALRERRLDPREVMDEFARQEGEGPPPAAEDEAAPPPRDGTAAERPPRPRRPPPPTVDAFRRRLVVLDPDGRLLLGHPQPVHRGPDIDRPIRLHGEVVARAHLMAADPLPGGLDARFLRTQYVGIASVSIGLALLALASAWWFARRWARPLVAVQDATTRMARGEFDVRVAGAGVAARSDEIGDVVRNVNRMAEGLERLEGARRRWLADISHELRTPLTVLRGDIEALVDGVRPLRPEAIVVLREEVLRLGGLVDDLHLLAMSDLRALPCHFGPTDAVRLLQQVVRRFEARAQAAGLDLTADAGGAAALPVRWDAARIEQLMGNLLENSLRYTDAPGRVALTLRRERQAVVLDIDDSAPGVPREDLPHLFEPLFRSDPARSRQRGGSGLGLAICEAIVHAHGGRIGAAASALGGLRLRIELPVSAGDAP